MEYASHVWEEEFTHTDSKNELELKAIFLITASIAIFHRYFHAYCSSEVPATACLHSIRARLNKLSLEEHTYALQTSLMQEFTSVSTLSTLSLLKAGVPSLLFLFFLFTA